MTENEHQPLEPPPTFESVGETILIGGYIDRTSASLRFFGDALDPDVITQLLQCEPTHAHRKGDLLPSRRYQRVAPTGSWRLHAPEGNHDTLENQICDLLDRVSADLDIWEQLFRLDLSRMDVFCGLHLLAWNRGFSLSPGLMKRLGERHLQSEFDIYCSGESDDEPSEV